MWAVDCSQSLCPALLALSRSDKPPLVPQALVQWSQRHARVLTTPWADANTGAGAPPASLPAQAEALHAAERPEAGSLFWRTLQRLAALGWAEDAVALLGLHSAWQEAYSGARNAQMLSLVRGACSGSSQLTTGRVLK